MKAENEFGKKVEKLKLSMKEVELTGAEEGKKTLQDIHIWSADRPSR